ncbi:NAD-dependent epimerase/dehydratase family protein, partial [Deinococcus sp.]|uniref:NAD-dependent epimerase/dehydratase family protein n=1 Tax=Deinococcus sp. TaxID=47478 RepID=UPI0025EBB70D
MAGMRFVWIRLLATYGPMDDPRHLLPSVVSQLLEGKCPALTPGEQLWDYLYVDDAVEAIARLGTDTRAAGIFNLGSGEAFSVRSVAELIRDKIDPALPLGFGEIPYRPDQVMHLQADITKLTDATGWRPQVSLAEGLSRTIAWHRAQAASLEQASLEQER